MSHIIDCTAKGKQFLLQIIIIINITGTQLNKRIFTL